MRPTGLAQHMPIFPAPARGNDFVRVYIDCGSSVVRRQEIALQSTPLNGFPIDPTQTWPYLSIGISSTQRAATVHQSSTVA